MHIVQISSELAPIAKVGGLADVALGLARELIAQGHTVEMILPKYDCLLQRQIEDFKVHIDNLNTFYEDSWHRVKVWQGTVHGLKVFFIDAPPPKSFFNRGCIYGAHDDVERFLYFSRAAIEFLVQTQRNPEIIHLHDWPTAPIAPIMRELYKEQPIANSKIVYTIHNIEYQGLCDPTDLDFIGLQGLELLHSGKLSDNSKPNTVNLMKGAIVHCDFFTTVSPTYAQEILTPREGMGMERTIVQYKNNFQGILNGIDYRYWNPEEDPLLSDHFSYLQLMHANWLGKEHAKRALRERLNLAQEQRPIIGCIARLIPQKGIHLLPHAIQRTVDQGGQFILLGTSPVAEIQAHFDQIKAANKGNSHVHLCLRTSEELAHQIFAGADAILIPSLFEPCGLTQMIAMRYGAVPIARRTGGLADTVFDVETSGLPETNTNGFTFDDADFSGVNWGIDRAIACWRDTPEKWRQIALRGMSMDFSWKKAALQYSQVYEVLLKSRPHSLTLSAKEKSKSKVRTDNDKHNAPLPKLRVGDSS